MEGWDLAAVNKGIVMVRISGYGQTGPSAEKPGFGSVAEGISGWAHSNGFSDSDPLLPPVPLADLTAGQCAAQATAFAVFERELEAGDEGQVIDIGLYEPLFRLFIGQFEAYDAAGHLVERTGNRSQNSAPRNVYPTADGHIALSASSQRIFENVMAAIDREDLQGPPLRGPRECRLRDGPGPRRGQDSRARAEVLANSGRSHPSRPRTRRPQ